MTDWDFFFKIVGLIGGIFLGICLIPQVYKTIVTKSTKDISLIWQLLYSTGLGLLYIYSLYFGLWSLYIPCSFEIICIFILIIYKIKNDGCNFEEINEEVLPQNS